MTLPNLLRIFSTSALMCLMFTLHANAAVINGINYKRYTGSGTTCPDGSNVFVYSGVKYCKAYRANISWTIPTKRVNGAALPISELKGYEIYWTRPSDKSKGTIKVGPGTKVSTTFDVYTPSTYYFAMSAIDTTGLKSPLSLMVEAYLGN